MIEKSTIPPRGEAENSTMSLGWIVVAAVVVIIIAATALYYFKTSRVAESERNYQPINGQGINQSGAMSGSGPTDGAVKVNPPTVMGGGQANEADKKKVKIYNLTAVPFEFSLTEIRVSLGDRVKINLTVNQGLHDWVVDEFNARTGQLTPGQSDSIEFTADRIGTFEYYCGVGNHRQMGMVGKLIVEK